MTFLGFKSMSFEVPFCWGSGYIGSIGSPGYQHFGEDRGCELGRTDIASTTACRVA